jgi:hypothetical protein
MERELHRKRIGLHKNDNAFLAADDVPQLQAAADRLSAQIIRKQLDYWTFLVGPKFSKKERGQMNLSRFCAIAQIEYCRNLICKRHFPIHKNFGVRLNKRLRAKLAAMPDQIEHGHHFFRAYWKNAFLSSVYWKSFCTVATRSGAGLPDRSVEPSSLPSNSPRKPTG